MIVGKAAPFFTGQALVSGGIQELNLDQYKGGWLVLFFYSGDFTFV